MTNGELVNILIAQAKAYIPHAPESLARNNHMHNANLERLAPEQIRAVVCDFVNFVGTYQCGMDVALYTKDLPKVDDEDEEPAPAAEEVAKQSTEESTEESTE